MSQAQRRPLRSFPAMRAALVLVISIGTMAPTASAEQIVLKNGAVLQGDVDRENTIVSIFDGLKRTVIRSTVIARTEPEPPSERQRMIRFSLIQPLEVHTGAMPSHALRIQATPWDEYGQRLFQYSYFADGQTINHVRMKQAINEIGPDYVRYRGIDGFWLGRIDTDQVPRSVILGLLDRVDRENRSERLRVGQFLIQAQWYDEAMAELNRLSRDFPDLESRIETVRRAVRDLQAQQVLDQSDLRRRVGQPRAAESLLATFSTEAVSPTLTERIAHQLDAIRAESDQADDLAEALRATLDAVSEADRLAHREPVYEILQALTEAPDAAQDRLVAFDTARNSRESDTDRGPEARLALALSGWVVGADHATADLDRVETLWNARDLIAAYLGTSEAESADRDRIEADLRGLSMPDDDENNGGVVTPIGLETVSQIIRHLPPPRAAEDRSEPQTPLIRRVLDDPNPTPTEYALLLPPEYHPLRSYPAVVALHDGRGPRSALDWWQAEAARNGYIVIAPEYMIPGKDPDYRYAADEHAAVLLALRDAKKRFAIDSDRVFLGGSLLGGNAAWDIGLAHPDVFAGVVSVSGLPAKYIAETRDHAEYVPLYVVIGDLATAATEALVFDMLKSMIRKTYDATYVEYATRGLEDLPEELPSIFDWMNRRTRTRHREDFEVEACRTCDDRFYGLVIGDFAPGRTTPPEAVDPLGRDLNPASIECKTSTLGNLLSLSVSGINQIDVWLTPDAIDFDRKVQIRVNGDRLYYDRVAPDLSALLEDVRIRGDRRQLYWAKISLGGKPRRGS